MMELFFEVLYALLGIYAIVDYRDVFFLCFRSLSVGNVDVRPFLLTTVEVIC